MEPKFPYSQKFLVVALLALGWGCVDPSAVLSLSVDGPEKLPPLLGEVLVEWDGEETWTRDMECQLAWDGEGSSYSVTVLDRSIGDRFDLVLQILQFEGPGDYERDRFQPQPAFALDLEEDGNVWRFASDSGGQCSFSVDERSRSGSFNCDDIPIVENLEVSSSTIAASGNWRCGVLTRAGFY